MSDSGLEAKGFFAALFDFSFTSFITLRFLKVIYAILVTLILLGGLFFLIGALTQGAGAAILGLIAVPVVTLLYLVIARIYMELVALFFRIGENTSIMARASGGGWGGTVLPPTQSPPASPGQFLPPPPPAPGYAFPPPASPQRFDQPPPAPGSASDPGSGSGSGYPPFPNQS